MLFVEIVSASAIVPALRADGRVMVPGTYLGPTFVFAIDRSLALAIGIWFHRSLRCCIFQEPYYNHGYRLLSTRGFTRWLQKQGVGASLQAARSSLLKRSRALPAT